jgi:flagellar assembly protein FliH
MILLSNVIKFFQYTSLDNKILVKNAAKWPNQSQKPEAEDASSEVSEELLEVKALKEQMLQDAEMYAEQLVRTAMEEAAEMKETAEAEIREWWEHRRSEDQKVIEEARQQGFEEGYREGAQQAEIQVKEKFRDMLDQARGILEQSYQLKEQIIQESEPFLIELSCAIAEKIVARQLTVEPRWVIDLIQSLLARRREKGIITLCVSPGQFSYIQDAREELVLHIDPQAELQIIPDASVTDHGCVVRSSFGSIDARIDTQLHEIKHALRQLARHDEGA